MRDRQSQKMYKPLIRIAKCPPIPKMYGSIGFADSAEFIKLNSAETMSQKEGCICSTSHTCLIVGRVVCRDATLQLHSALVDFHCNGAIQSSYQQSALLTYANVIVSVERRVFGVQIDSVFALSPLIAFMLPSIERVYRRARCLSQAVCLVYLLQVSCVVCVLVSVSLQCLQA